MSITHSASLNLDLSAVPTATPSAATDGFDTGDKFGQGAEMSLMFVAVGGTNATITVYQWFSNTNTWVPIETAVTVTSGTAKYLRVPPYARIFVRVTAQTGDPSRLLVAVVPGTP